MNRTQIEWVRNPDGSQGYTWNPITGCLNHMNGLCKGGDFSCYAYKLAHGRLKQRYIHSRGWKIDYDPSKEGYTEACFDPFYPRFWEERLDEPCGILKDELNYDPRSIKPKGIFVCDMSDLFGVGIPEQWTHSVMNFIEACRQHRFYILTKQAQNLPNFSPFPETCWVGVTATNADMSIRAGYCLTKIQASVKFLSLEPLLDWEHGKPGFIATMLQSWGIGWLIIGACTGTLLEMVSLRDRYPKLAVMRYENKLTAQPRIEWVREIVEAADKAGIPVFLKDNLKSLLVKYKDGSEYAPLWANGGYGTLRQEIPETKLSWNRPKTNRVGTPDVSHHGTARANSGP